MKVRFLKNNGENSQQFIILLSIGVIIVVGIALFILQNIWFGDNDKVEAKNDVDTDENTINKELQIGQYSSVSNGQSLILKEYFSDIFRVLSSGTKDEIYSKISKDYISKYNYDSTRLYNKLKNKNLIGKAFQSDKYSYAENPRFGRVYSLEISSIDGSVLEKLMIIEDKPRSYSLSFDSYVGTKKQDIEVIREGVKLSITSVEEYKDRVYFDIIIQNLNEESVILNKGAEANEAIYVQLPGEKKVYNIMTFFSSNEIELESNGKVSARVEFLISDLQSAKIQKMCLVNVYNSQSKTTSTFEYEIY